LGIPLFFSFLVLDIIELRSTSFRNIYIFANLDLMRTMQWNRMETKDFTILEIYNDTLPLKGKLTISFMEGEIKVFYF